MRDDEIRRMKEISSGPDQADEASATATRTPTIMSNDKTRVASSWSTHRQPHRTWIEHGMQFQ